jgi:hypothetical protein
VARKNPVGKLAETALSTLKDPKAAAGKVVEQAKGTVALGRAVADTAASAVGKAAGKKSDRKGRAAASTVTSPRTPVRTEPKSPADLRPVPDVTEPATSQPAAPAKKQGDALAEETKAATAQKRAKKAPAKKAAAKKAPAKKAAAKKAPAKKTSATPADVADVVESAVAEDPARTAAKPATKSAKKAPAAKTPSDKLPAKKAPTKKASAKKTATKKTTKKAATKKASAKKSAPKTAADLASVEGEDVSTPAGTPAAAEGTNPSTGDTSLTQPGTEPVVDSTTAKQVASESEKLRKAAEPNPE